MNPSFFHVPRIDGEFSESTTRDDLDHERALVARLRDGDREAFRVLVKQYINQVTKFAYYIVQSRDTAEDIAQSVFIYIWDHRTALDPARPLKPYLFRAVRNRALDERKASVVRDRYRTEVQGDAVAGAIHAVTPSPERKILTIATVQSALNRLSERRRLAVRLRLEEDMTHAEIAEVLNLTPENAKRLVGRAITELQKILGVSH